MISDIPLSIIMNKQDLPNLVDIRVIREILEKKGLKKEEEYSPIYQTCALLENEQNISITFQEIFNELK